MISHRKRVYVTYVADVDILTLIWSFKNSNLHFLVCVCVHSRCVMYQGGWLFVFTWGATVGNESRNFFLVTRWEQSSVPTLYKSIQTRFSMQCVHAEKLQSYMVSVHHVGEGFAHSWKHKFCIVVRQSMSVKKVLNAWKNPFAFLKLNFQIKIGSSVPTSALDRWVLVLVLCHC